MRKIFKRIRNLVKVDFISNASIFLLFSLMGLFYTLLWGILMHFIGTKPMYDIYLVQLPLLNSLLLASTFSLSSVYNDKKYQTGEMLLTTNLKAHEYLLAKWFGGFIAGFFGSLISLILFVVITKEFYLNQDRIEIWFYPALFSLVVSFAAVLLGILIRIKNAMRKTIYFILVSFPPAIVVGLKFIATFLKMPFWASFDQMGFVLPSLLVYSAACFFLAIKALKIKDLIT